MRKIYPLRIVFAIFLTLTCIPLPALGAAAPWYQFEIIIFERIAKSAGSTELWPRDPGTPSRLNALPVKIGASRSPGNSAVKVLPKSAWRLTELEQRLKRSRNYRPHVHLAWRQRMVRPDRAQLLYIEMMDKQNAPNRVKDYPKIEGTLKVGVKRYLHLETDLLLRRLKMGQHASRQAGMASPYYQAYRLKSRRRMRSGQLHYLDHPLIGVLILASKYQQPEPAEPVNQETTPTGTTQSGITTTAPAPTDTQ